MNRPRSFYFEDYDTKSNPRHYMYASEAEAYMASQQSKLEELTAQIELIQANAAINYAAAEHKAHKLEVELAVTKHALELAADYTDAGTFFFLKKAREESAALPDPPTVADSKRGEQ